MKEFSTSAILFIFLTFLVHAQESTSTNSFGIISGYVRDAITEQPLPGATVLITGTKLGAATNEQGYYVITNIPIGNYSVHCSFIGYEKSGNSDIIVSKNRNATVNFALTQNQIQTSSVTVTSGYYHKAPDVTTSFRSLTPQEIRRSPGSAEDIFRVMQSLPGVATAGGKSAQLIVRGGSPDENLTFLDNIEIYNPIHFARSGESMGIISIVNPALLNKVDFMTGGFPAKYGDKMSSVFEMSLAEGNKEIYNTDLNANLGGFGAMVDGPISKNGTMIFSARRGFFDLLTSLMGKPAAPKYYDVVGKTTFDINNENKISLVGFYYLDQIAREGTTKSSSTISKYDYLNRDDFGTAIGLNWRYLFAKSAYALTTFSFSGNGWNTLQGTQSNPSLRGEDIRENTYSAKSEITWDVFPKLEMKTGFEVKLLTSKHITWKPEDTTRIGQIIPASSVSYLPPVSKKFTGFIQDTWSPISRLSVTTGLRYDYFSFIGEGSISPRISMTFYLTDKTSFNAAYGKFYQTPASYQIALDAANILLKSSLATHYVLGVDHLFTENTKGTIEVYYKNLTNGFVTDDTTDVITNLGKGFAKGIEFSLQKKFANGFVGSASYSYSISKRQNAAGLPEYYFEYDRPHVINIVTGIELSETWQLGIKFQYASGSPYTPVLGAAINRGTYYLVEGGFNSSRYPDYHKIDIRLDKKFVFSSWTLTAYLDLWNVYNRENVLSYTYKVDNSGIITKQERLDFGLLPILGLSAQF